MDHTTLQIAVIVFNVAVMVISALMGWFVRSLMDRVKELESQNREQLDKLADLRTELPTHYVRRDDFKELADSLFTLLRRIEDKLERKADRP